MRNLVISIDFDGTIRLPAAYGTPVEESHLSYGFGKFYDWCIRHNVVLVLWTCRNLNEEKELSYVYDFLAANDLTEIFIPMSDVNGKLLCRSLSGKEVQLFSSGSQKMIADLYIDDRAVGCPVLPNYTEQVDWAKVLNTVKTYLNSLN